MATNNISETPIQVDQESIILHPETAMSAPETVIGEANRIASVDFLRGLVMIIMALDHVRAYLHFDSLIHSPPDLHSS